MEKLCSKCGQLFPVKNFHYSEKRGYQAYCIPCRKLIDAEAYQRNKEKRSQQAKDRRKELLVWARELKMQPCTDCGQCYHPVCMQWDHLPEYEKVDDVAELVRGGCSKAKILEEIEKCELVCANCHALRTYYRWESDSR